MRGQPMTEARNNTSTGLSETPAAMISRCFQIGTAQWAGALLSIGMFGLAAFLLSTKSPVTR
jgi:hypothetical protein